ncbi:hypothetical protein TRAPUB_1631 [Trametes pubescens]|uniref:Major facilitator superfamily (MFS) profile domain-containing protein n=1 Tax=Trametes pubescens TaxID=154538 RepID=A0A1M2VIW2_TRAPU|nr:hypothetical protein TRAPUB_1631 [Trametes pubescens]
MSPSSPPTIIASPPEGKQESEFVVFERDDVDDPHQWSRRKKRSTVALACLYAFCAVFGSAIYAPGEEEIREKYGVSADVSSTGLTMYVLGFGIAPLIWGRLAQ